MALYDLKKDGDLDKAVKYFHELIQKPCIIELTKKNPIRSLNQNAYLHLLFTWFSMETGYSEDYVKQYFFKKVVNNSLFRTLVDGKFGRRVEWRSTASLDSAEMTKAIERFRNWAGVKGVDLPAPENKQWLEHIRIEASRKYYT